MQLCTITSLTCFKWDYLYNHMCYPENIVELINVSPSMEHQNARSYPRKWHYPMKTHIYYNSNKRHWFAPTRILNATPSAICSGKTDRATNEPKNLFIGKHQFNVFSPITYPEPHKLDYGWKAKFHKCVSNNRIDYWPIQISSAYMRAV